MRCLLALLLACRPGKDSGSDSAKDTAADSGEDTAADPGQVDDTGGDSADTAEPANATGPVVFEVTVRHAAEARPTAPLTVAAVRLHFGEGPRVGKTLASAPIGGLPATRGGAARIALPAHPGGLEAPDPEDADLRVAIAALVVFEDIDRDAAFTEGEPVRGWPLDQWLVFRTGDGWTVADLGLGGQYTEGRCLGDTTAPLSWREGYPIYGEPLRPIWLHGARHGVRLSGAASDASERLAGIPWQVATGTDPTLEPVLDQALTDPYQVNLLTEPPETHDVNSDPDWRYTVALPRTYRDDDGDGRWSAAETTGAAPCHGELPVFLRYNREISTWRGARLLDCYAGRVGWSAIVFDEATGEAVYLDETDGLDIDPARCGD